MSQKVIEGSEQLAKTIRSRRLDLGLTIEEAAARAEVGTKTWCRYEAGESIRKDKCKGICKALNWRTLAEQGTDEDEVFSVQNFKKDGAWSAFLEKEFGVDAAMAFAVGSELLGDNIRGDMEELAALPAGAHIGQLPFSWLRDTMPGQFLMHYDYEFLYQMKCALHDLRLRAKGGLPLCAHSVMEELLFYLCAGEAGAAMEPDAFQEDDAGREEWVFALFDDMDIVTYLYGDIYLEQTHPYHFSHWAEPQFYTDRA